MLDILLSFGTLLRYLPSWQQKFVSLAWLSTMLADSFLAVAQFGLSLVLMSCADFWQISQKNMSPRTQNQKKNPWKINPSCLSTGELWFPGLLRILAERCNFHVEFHSRRVACTDQTEAFFSIVTFGLFACLLGAPLTPLEVFASKKTVNIMTQL